MKQLTITTALILAATGSLLHAEPQDSIPTSPSTLSNTTPLAITPPASTTESSATESPATESPATEPSSENPTTQTPPSAPTRVIKKRMAPLTEKGLNQRYEFMGNLVERSSSAQQVEKSGSPEAKKLHQEAKDMRARAKEAIDAGDLETADTLLRDTTKTMMEAARLARPEEITGKKAITDFNNRRSSVEVLLSTGRRVAGEKDASRPEFVKAEELVKEADALAAENKHAEGKKKLDIAYGLVKNSLRDMRGGEQLVADKNFATKADEYKYEQGRNDDYLDLIGGVIEGKEDPSWGKMADKARAMRKEADEMNESGDVEAALKKINQSTSQFKSILRRSGFPII